MSTYLNNTYRKIMNISVKFELRRMKRDWENFSFLFLLETELSAMLIFQQLIC